MRPLASSLQRRRRPTPTRISTRPRRSDASTIWSTICANPSVPDGSHVAAQVGPCKVWRQRRLPIIEVWGRHEHKPITYHYELGVELVPAAARYNPFEASDYTYRAAIEHLRTA